MRGRALNTALFARGRTAGDRAPLRTRGKSGCYKNSRLRRASGMTALGWLVLCALVGLGRGNVCPASIFGTSADLALGAQCPVSSTPYNQLTYKTCPIGQIMTTWKIYRNNLYVVKMDFSCCPAGVKFYITDTSLCSSQQSFQLEEWNTGFFSLARDSSSIQYSIDTTFYAVAINTPGWGFNSFQTVWNSYGLIGLHLTSTVGGIQTSFESVIPPADTTRRPYQCPSGTNIIGVYYKSGTRTITSGSSSATYNLFSDFGFQCMPLNCPLAKYSSPSASECLDCPVGTYSSKNFITACTQCTAGNTDNDAAAVKYTSSGGTSDSCSYTCNSGYGGGGTAVSRCGTGCCRCLAGYFSVSPNTCTSCQPGTVSVSSGSAACTACRAGETFMNAIAGTACIICSPISANPGYYKTLCTVVKNTEINPCPACAAGNELSPSCNTGVNTGQVPVCVQCPAGKIQANPIASGAITSPTCTLCGAGSFQSSPGKSRCDNCRNLAPANGAYAAWTGLAVDGNNCPTLCFPGFGWNGSTCLQCGLGKYGTGGLIPTTASTCQSCLPLTSNGYWVQPVQFNRSWAGCPWDCNAGYYRTSLGNCALCNSGTYSSRVRVADNEAVNQCQVCTVCASGFFSSSNCTASRNTICSACITSCTYGSYLKLQCTSTTNNVCVTCRTCAEGQYMTGVCSGQVTLVLYVFISNLTCLFFADELRQRQLHTMLVASVLRVGAVHASAAMPRHYAKRFCVRRLQKPGLPIRHVSARVQPEQRHGVRALHPVHPRQNHAAQQGGFA